MKTEIKMVYFLQLRETRIVFLYAIPSSILVYFLKYMEWDAGFLILFLELLIFFNIISREDRGTLDEDIRTFLVTKTSFFPRKVTHTE